MTTLDVAQLDAEHRVIPEPAAHAAGMAHPAPVAGCPWCLPVKCPCGGDCPDAGGCRRRWAASETTWREVAVPAFAAGSVYYGGRR
jgi:hypothetical protein